ncbi:hypothetical protein Tco_0565376 [Tanacetum coccineum]
MVERDDEIKVLGEVNVELESCSKKLREKLLQKDDTEEEAFEEFSSTLDNVLEKLSHHVSILVGIGIHQLVVAQNNVHEGVAEKVIEMANDQAEVLSSDKEVNDECLDDEHVEESRLSKRIRVTQEEMIKDEKPKKDR